MATTKLYPLGHDREVSFQRLMSLKEIGNGTFESQTEAFAPPETGGRRAYGGHVFAQAAYAASRTVPKNFVIHHVSGNWTTPGMAKRRFRYLVRAIRDGGMYSLRIVEAYQDACSRAKDDHPAPCFVSLVAFKRSNSQSQKWAKFHYQAVPKNYLEKEYGQVLAGLQLENPRQPPDYVSPAWQMAESPTPRKIDGPPFPGLETLQVDMTRYNDSRKRERGGGADGTGAAHFRQLHLYRLIEEKRGSHGASEPCSAAAAIHENDGDDPNLHAAAHLYASDRHALFLIPRALGYEKPDVNIASMALTVVLHHPVEPMRTLDARGRAKWFVQEAWTTQGGENRGTHESRVYDYETGRIVSTTLQDGVIKIPVVNVEDDRPQDRNGRAGVKL